MQINICIKKIKIHGHSSFHVDTPTWSRLRSLNLYLIRSSRTSRHLWKRKWTANTGSRKACCNTDIRSLVFTDMLTSSTVVVIYTVDWTEAVWRERNCRNLKLQRVYSKKILSGILLISSRIMTPILFHHCLRVCPTFQRMRTFSSMSPGGGALPFFLSYALTLSNHILSLHVYSLLPT